MKKERTTTYLLPLSDVKQAIIGWLSLDGKVAKFDFVIQEVGGDSLDRFPGVKALTEVRVVVQE